MTASSVYTPRELIDAVARERERCAKICEDYAEEHVRGVMGSMAEELWGHAHAKRLAKLIRGEK